MAYKTYRVIVRLEGGGEPIKGPLTRDKAVAEEELRVITEAQRREANPLLLLLGSPSRSASSRPRTCMKRGQGLRRQLRADNDTERRRIGTCATIRSSAALRRFRSLQRPV